jgi:hypothetical protein
MADFGEIKIAHTVCSNEIGIGGDNYPDNDPTA